MKKMEIIIYDDVVIVIIHLFVCELKLLEGKKIRVDKSNSNTATVLPIIHVQ